MTVATLIFEMLSGVRPAYELHLATLRQRLHWTAFVAPALFSAVFGGAVTQQLRLRAFR